MIRSISSPSALIILLLLHPRIEVDSTYRHPECPYSFASHDRKLFVAMCDSRGGIRGLSFTKLWNITGQNLRDQGASMVNVCYNYVEYGKHGTLTKPLLFNDYIKKNLLQKPHSDLYYVILMDSDTYWSIDSLQRLWNLYDCARNNKNVVISSEMNCWIGRYCSEEDVQKWFPDLPYIPSYSPFLNSGIVMGKAYDVSFMLDYVINNNQSYYVQAKYKQKFDDQLAIADYALYKARENVSLDYYQLLAGNFAIHAPQINKYFVCKSLNGTLSSNCGDYTLMMSRKGYLYVNSTTCALQRKIYPTLPFYEYLTNLSVTPALWHGNGVGKPIWKHFGVQIYDCFLKKRNITNEQFMHEYVKSQDPDALKNEKLLG